MPSRSGSVDLSKITLKQFSGSHHLTNGKLYAIEGVPVPPFDEWQRECLYLDWELKGWSNAELPYPRICINGACHKVHPCARAKAATDTETYTCAANLCGSAIFTAESFIWVEIFQAAILRHTFTMVPWGTILWGLHCWDDTVGTILWGLHCGDYTVGTALWGLHCEDCTMGTILWGLY